MITRSVLTTRDQIPAGRGYALSVNHRIVVTEPGNGMGIELVRQFQAQGYRNAQVVTQIPLESDVVIILDGLRKFSDQANAIACNQKVFSAIQPIAERFTQKGGLLISVQDTGGEFALHKADAIQIWAAGLTGLIKTAAQEWPKACCRAIDLQQADQTIEQLAKRLLHEILWGGKEQECGLLADGRRIIPALVATQAHTAQQLRIKPKSVIVVTGGARGVTAACVIALAKKDSAHFILLGRTALRDEPANYRACETEQALRELLLTESKQQQKLITPKEIQQKIARILANREIHTTLTALKSAGATAQYFAVDIMDYDQLQITWQKIRQQAGTIKGIIHGAGILADKLIAQKTLEQFNQVFNTKIEGLRNLLQVARKDELSLLIFFSSVAARFGNPGQVDYAMANEVLNKVAQYEQQQRGKKCLVKAINWGPWESGMVTPELKSLFAARDIALLSLERGTQMFLDELSTDKIDEVEVVCGAQLANNKIQKTFIVDAESHKFLLSHVIQNVPVLPACLVLEWFWQTLVTADIDRKNIICRNFKVLRGIRLVDFPLHSYQFVAQCEKNTDGNYTINLLSDKGDLHYSAEFIVSSTDIVASVPANIAGDVWRCQNIYSPAADKNAFAKLFHGKDFHAIAALEMISAQGGSGTLRGIKQLGWSGMHWKSDVAILDGVLQLLRLWGYEQLNKATLPTQFADYIQYQQVLPQEAVKCVFRGQVKGKYRLLADAVVLLSDGQRYAEWRGIEMCAS